MPRERRSFSTSIPRTVASSSSPTQKALQRWCAAAGISQGNLLFEAPTTALQAHFVTRIGPDVNLANVAPDGTSRVFFDPEDKSEVEVHGETYVVMRERDVHAVAGFK